MEGGNRSASLVCSGAAMPWAKAGAAAPAPLMPASMTFGLPFLGMGGASRRRAAPFASVSASAQAPPKLFATRKVEPATGIAYPDHLCVITKSHCPGLAGVG